jgi:hypothetical protein
MMEDDLRSLLKANAGISALANAVEWNEVEQGTQPPYLILEYVFDPREKKMDGPQVTRKTRIRTKSFFRKGASGFNLKEAVIAALEGATRTTVGSTLFLGAFPNELGDMQIDTPDGIRNCKIVDFEIAHTIP